MQNKLGIHSTSGTSILCPSTQLCFYFPLLLCHSIISVPPTNPFILRSLWFLPNLIETLRYNPTKCLHSINQAPVISFLNRDPVSYKRGSGETVLSFLDPWYNLTRSNGYFIQWIFWTSFLIYITQIWWVFSMNEYKISNRNLGSFWYK